MTPFRWALLAAAALMLWFIGAVSSILFPFAAGFAVAYLLDPITDRLEKLKLPRSVAAFAAIVVFFSGLAVFMALLLPVLSGQVAAFVHQLGDAAAALRPFLAETLTRIGKNTGSSMGQSPDSLINDAMHALLARSGAFLEAALMQGAALFNLFALMLVSPIIAYYLLVDWDRMVAKLDAWLPPTHADAIRRHARDIDRALSGFVRGQTAVCACFVLLFSIGWSLAGLDHAILLACLAGLLGYIPAAGKFMATILALLMGFGQWGLDFSHLGAVAAVYLAVLVLDNAVLTPRFVGNAAGLHPVWVLFAIFSGGALMGAPGVLLAVPVAASINVLVRSGIETWLGSRYFQTGDTSP